LYLKTRRILKCGIGFTKIANECLGPYSSVLINALIALAVFGILTLYMLLFSRIAIQLFSPESITAGKAVGFLGHKEVYIIGLSVLIIPVIVKKRLAELKFTTYILFIGVICLVSLLTIKLQLEGSYDYKIEKGIIEPVV